MNTPIILAAIAAPCIAVVVGVIHALATGRFVDTPSPCERDAQDGRGEGGKFGPGHTGEINHGR